MCETKIRVQKLGEKCSGGLYTKGDVYAGHYSNILCNDHCCSCSAHSFVAYYSPRMDSPMFDWCCNFYVSAQYHFVYHTWCSCGERQPEDTSLCVCVYVHMHADVEECIRGCGSVCMCE